MALLPKAKEMLTQYIKLCQGLEVKAKENSHRYLVVLSGDKQWAKDTLASVLPALQLCETLLVSDHDLNEKFDLGVGCQSIQAKEVKAYLGSECARLVWNGFCGINPDALGAASGLITGGGLLFLILPEFVKLETNHDPDYLRMCRQPEELSNFGTRFLKRMIHLIKTNADVTLLCQKDEAKLSHSLTNHLAPINIHTAPDQKVENNALKLPNRSSLSASGQLTNDQSQLIEAIKTVSKGHRKRPLVVLADRGRGKTSALGVAAARVTLEQSLKVIITAPNKRACDAAFKHYRQETGSQDIKSTNDFEFFAPDTLLENLPKCHLLLVDEAASIPAPMLKHMLEAYPRVIFSSTTHGYEGTGQGFNVRFRHTLDALTPEWKSLTLDQPVRWAEADPLERWIFEFLLLNAHIPQLSSTDISADYTETVEWVSQDTLFNNEHLLKQTTALLVTAHYQTSPSDIRMILDDPNITIGLIQKNSTVMAVVLLLLEGGINDSELAQDIIQGTRRPKGHLVPQALTSSSAITEFLPYTTYRIMRIAVHPSLSRHGLGSRLITAASRLGQKNNIDYLSASFGFTPLLNDFWCKNDFQLLRIGYHKDAASGAQSAIVVRTLNTNMQQTLLLAHTQCLQHFIFGLNTVYQTLDVETTIVALQSFELPINQQSSNEIDIVRAFAHHHRSFEDCAQILFIYILNCFSMRLIQVLSREEQQLVCLRILKGINRADCAKQLKISGKKQLDTTLKVAISKLLDSSS